MGGRKRGGYTEAPLPLVRMGGDRANARDRTHALSVARVHIVAVQHLSAVRAALCPWSRARLPVLSGLCTVF